MKNNIKTILLKNINTAYSVPISLLKEDEILNLVADKLKNNFKIIQFYNPNLSDQQNIKIALKIHQLCSFYNAIFIINSRCDLAQIIDSDGVYLNKDDVTISQAKKILCESKIFGSYIPFDESDYHTSNEISKIHKINLSED